jgi:exodeoxyribonuclease VII small subunit
MRVQTDTAHGRTVLVRTTPARLPVALPPAYSRRAMNTPSVPPEIAQLSFEDALKELEAIVRKIEEGRSGLDDAISAYERGVLLKLHCEAKLKDAQSKIEQISLSQDGRVSAEPFGDR